MNTARPAGGGGKDFSGLRPTRHRFALPQITAGWWKLGKAFRLTVNLAAGHAASVCPSGG